MVKPRPASGRAARRETWTTDGMHRPRHTRPGSWAWSRHAGHRTGRLGTLVNRLPRYNDWLSRRLAGMGRDWSSFWHRSAWRNQRASRRSTGADGPRRRAPGQRSSRRRGSRNWGQRSSRPPGQSWSGDLGRNWLHGPAGRRCRRAGASGRNRRGRQPQPWARNLQLHGSRNSR